MSSAPATQEMDARSARRVVAALSASAFAEWGGATAVLPLLPIYLKHLGSSAALIGLTMAAFYAAALLVQYPLGRLSDRIGRRKVQVGGLITYAIASLLFIVIASPVLALVLRALQGCGAGIVDVANAATIAEVVPPARRGRAFGTFYGARNISMAVGPFIGGVVGIEGMRWLFLVAALAALAAIIPVMLLLPGRRPARVPGEVAARRSSLWHNRGFLGVAVAFVSVGLVIGTYEVCWSLLLQARSATNWQIGLSWTLFAIPFAVMSYPAGWLTDRMDRRYLVAISMAGSGCFALIYPWIPSVAWLLGLSCVESVLVALDSPAVSAQLAQSVPSNEYGRAQGAAASAQTLATAVAAGLAGSLFAVNEALPFVSAGIGILICVGLLWPLWRGVPGRSMPVVVEADEVRQTA